MKRLTYKNIRFPYYFSISLLDALKSILLLCLFLHPFSQSATIPFFFSQLLNLVYLAVLSFFCFLHSPRSAAATLFCSTFMSLRQPRDIMHVDGAGLPEGYERTKELKNPWVTAAVTLFFTENKGEIVFLS
jgi:hypothetical protein